MGPTYIDEAAGSDETGDGTQNAPYKTLAYALAQHASDVVDDLEPLVRKDAETPYEKPSDSSLKRAKKNADGLRKKAAKAAELAARDAERRAETERKLEESKKVILVEDESLPKAKKVLFSCLLIHIDQTERRGYHVRRRLTGSRTYAGRGCV